MVGTGADLLAAFARALREENAVLAKGTFPASVIRPDERVAMAETLRLTGLAAPSPEALRALRRLLEENADLWRAVGKGHDAAASLRRKAGAGVGYAADGSSVEGDRVTNRRSL